MSKPTHASGISSITHQLHQASQNADELLSLTIDDGEITGRQLVVLNAVGQSKNPSQTDICAVTGIDRSTLADIVRRLVAKGLLRRRRTRSDARRYAVWLTADGKSVVERSIPAVAQVDKYLLEQVGPEQRDCFVSALGKLARLAPVPLPRKS